MNGVTRQAVNFKSLRLTDIVVKIGRGAKLATLLKAYKAADVDAKWSKTAEARKIAIRAARAASSDFDRFKLRHAKRVRASLVKPAAAPAAAAAAAPAAGKKK